MKKIASLLSAALMALPLAAAAPVTNANQGAIQENTDGSKTIQGDGSTVEIQPDGTKSIRGADGTQILIKPDGTKIVQDVDGTSIMIDPNGSKVIQKADGTTIQINPNQ